MLNFQLLESSNIDFWDCVNSDSLLLSWYAIGVNLKFLKKLSNLKNILKLGIVLTKILKIVPAKCYSWIIILFLYPSIAVSQIFDNDCCTYIWDQWIYRIVFISNQNFRYFLKISCWYQVWYLKQKVSLTKNNFKKCD